MERKRTVNERVQKIERVLWGENGHKGLIKRQEEDEERFNKLYDKYSRAVIFIETIVNFGRWVTRIGAGIATLIGAVKYKEIWQWLTESSL